MIVKSLYGLHHMPNPLSPLDLSKVVVECGSISHPSLKESYARGLKVYKLEIDHSESLEEDFGNSKFPGLHVINLAMHRYPIFLEWFPRLASTHPLLQKVIFVSMSNSEIQYTADTITSLLPFIAKSSQQGLDTTFGITRPVISRYLAHCPLQSGRSHRAYYEYPVLPTCDSSICRFMFPIYTYIGVGIYHERRYNVDELVAVLVTPSGAGWPLQTVAIP